MSDLFNHYKPRGIREIDYRWVLYDGVMPDEVLRGLMGEVEPVKFDRKAGRVIVGFYSDYGYMLELLDKVRAWEKEFAEPIHAARREREAAEREAKFQEYFRSLNLDAGTFAPFCPELAGLQ